MKKYVSNYSIIITAFVVACLVIFTLTLGEDAKQEPMSQAFEAKRISFLKNASMKQVKKFSPRKMPPMDLLVHVTEIPDTMFWFMNPDYVSFNGPEVTALVLCKAVVGDSVINFYSLYQFRIMSNDRDVRIVSQVLALRVTKAARGDKPSKAIEMDTLPGTTFLTKDFVGGESLVVENSPKAKMVEFIRVVKQIQDEAEEAKKKRGMRI